MKKPTKAPANPVAKHAHAFNRCTRMQDKRRAAQLVRGHKHKARDESSGSFERKGLVTDEKSVLL